MWKNPFNVERADRTTASSTTHNTSSRMNEPVVMRTEDIETGSIHSEETEPKVDVERIADIVYRMMLKDMILDKERGV